MELIYLKSNEAPLAQIESFSTFMPMKTEVLLLEEQEVVLWLIQ